MLLETKWYLLDELFSWALLLVGLCCLTAFLISAGKFGLGLHQRDQEVVQHLMMPLIGWGVALAAVSIVWAMTLN